MQASALHGPVRWRAVPAIATLYRWLPLCRHLAQHRVKVERRRLLPRRELGESLDFRGHHGLHQVHLRHVTDHPVEIGIRVVLGPFKRVATEIHDVRDPQLHERLGPLSHLMGALLRQMELVVPNPHRDDIAIVAEIDE